MGIGTTVRVTVDRWNLLNLQIEEIEKSLATLKKERDNIVDSILVNALMSNGTRLMVLDDGTKIEVARHIKGKIVPGAEAEAFKFLDDQGFGANIKKTFLFDKGEDTSFLEAEIKERGITCKTDINIHYKSLDKAVGDILKTAEQQNPDVLVDDIIPNCINIDIFNQATIKIGK